MEYLGLSECSSWIAERDMMIAGLDGAGDIVVQPNQRVKVLLTIQRDDLPPVSLKNLNLNDLKVSTRSCIAQSGVFLYLAQDGLSDEEILVLEKGGVVSLGGKLVNYGPNPLEFRLADSLARFFYTNPKDRIIGKDLRKLVDSGLIGGIEGKDFLIFKEGKAGVVAVKVSKKRVYIPNVGNGRAIRIASRDDLYNLTRMIDKRTSVKELSCLFHLLETQPEVNLPSGVMGELSVVTSKKDVTHLPSRLIDPGSHWAVRLEISGGWPDWVLMKFYRNQKLKINVNDKRSTFDKSLINS